jgi:hypothetical protein
MEQKAEMKFKELFEEAHRDPVLKMKLLNHPEAVAKEWGVNLGEREIGRLKKVGAFLELSNELKSGRVFRCNPQVCYPVTVWFRNEAISLLREYVIILKKDCIFYPAERQIDHQLGLEQMAGTLGGSTIGG